MIDVGSSPSATRQAGSTAASRVARAGTIALYCFPYAGGSTTIYRSWRLLAPPSIDVRPVELPGRGTRLREHPIGDYAALVDRLAEDLLADLARRRGGGRFALFGHSAGARFAFGVAARLFERDAPAPEHLFVAAVPPPRSVGRDRRRGHMNDEELAAELRLMGGTAEEILADPTLVAHVLPVLRADLRCSEAAHLDRDRHVSCPLTAFAARGDQLVELEAVSEWAHHARRGFSLVDVQGGHFEVLRTPAILRHIAARLAAGGHETSP